MFLIKKMRKEFAVYYLICHLAFGKIIPKENQKKVRLFFDEADGQIKATSEPARPIYDSTENLKRARALVKKVNLYACDPEDMWIMESYLRPLACDESILKMEFLKINGKLCHGVVVEANYVECEMVNSTQGAYETERLFNAEAFDTVLLDERLFNTDSILANEYVYYNFEAFKDSSEVEVKETVEVTNEVVKTEEVTKGVFRRIKAKFVNETKTGKIPEKDGFECEAA